MVMQLLTPEEVKRGPSKALHEQQAIARDLAIEETRLVNSINFLRGEERDEKARIREDVATFRNHAQVEIVELDTQIAVKKVEVESLERRRAEAMRPIEEIRKEADERNEKSKAFEQALAKREEKVIADEEIVTERLEKISDREQEQNEREKEQDERARLEQDAAERLKASADTLNEKWSIYHAAVIKKNREYSEREAKITADAAKNEINRLENEKRAADYSEKDREIASRYEALERAHLQILGTK